MPTRVANRFATAFLLCAGLGCAVFAGDRGSRAEQSRYSDWAEGPVRYLITKTESRLFRKLPTPDERLAFIRRFWDRRDPNPVTPANEARLAFWQRVSEANAQFSDSALPGWKTDRGKIYILLGPPDDIERDFEYDTRIAGSANRGLMRWVYKGIDNASTRAIQVVPFVRLDDSDWHLTDDPRFASATFNIYDDPTTSASAFYREYGSFSRFADDLPWLGSRLGTAMDLGRLQEVPTESDLLTAVVRAEDFLGTLPGALVVHSLHGPGGRNLLALTIAVKRDALTPACGPGPARSWRRDSPRRRGWCPSTRTRVPPRSSSRTRRSSPSPRRSRGTRGSGSRRFAKSPPVVGGPAPS
ncbi:MAG: GWxTD domain-containing protein [Acidobacteria bacterium]|nr:GWxTD domain-containing protein [Acidobacteriota bacterium]